MITFVKLTCPNCGASLEVDQKLTQCFCTYCGTKILLHNENEYVTRIVDEARLAEQENERLRIEHEKQKYEDKKAEKEKNNRNVGRNLLAVALGYVTAFLVVFAAGGILTGGFLNFLMSLVCIGVIASMWFGFKVCGGKTQLRKYVGVLILIADAIVFLYCGMWAVPLMSAT